MMTASPTTATGVTQHARKPINWSEENEVIKKSHNKSRIDGKTGIHIKILLPITLPLARLFLCLLPFHPVYEVARLGGRLHISSCEMQQIQILLIYNTQI